MGQLGVINTAVPRQQRSKQSIRKNQLCSLSLKLDAANPLSSKQHDHLAKRQFRDGETLYLSLISTSPIMSGNPIGPDLIKVADRPE